MSTALPIVTRTQVIHVAWPPDPNPPKLYRFATGAIIKHIRDEDTDYTQEQMAKLLGLTQRGYAKVEYGETTNWDLYMRAATVLEKEWPSIQGLARVIVRLIQAEELSQDRECTKEERKAIAAEYLAGMQGA